MQFVPSAQLLARPQAQSTRPCRCCGASVESCNAGHVREGWRCCYGNCDHPADHPAADEQAGAQS